MSWETTIGPYLLRRLGVWLLATAVIFAVSSTIVPGIAAALPSNDEFADATVITEPLPFTDVIDTSGATTAASDPFACAESRRDTVWYAYTPTSTSFVEADASESSFDALLSVWTGTEGHLNEVACAEIPMVTFEATAGTTYYIMVEEHRPADAPGDSGGTLRFTFDVSLPPWAIDDVTIAPVGRIRVRSGEAIIRGTISCSGPAYRVGGLDFFLKQRSGHLVTGRGSVVSGGEDFFECGARTPWRVVATGLHGRRFRPGPAHVSLAFEGGPVGACTPCAFTERHVLLRVRQP